MHIHRRRPVCWFGEVEHAADGAWRDRQYTCRCGAAWLKREPFPEPATWSQQPPRCAKASGFACAFDAGHKGDCWPSQVTYSLYGLVVRSSDGAVTSRIGV